MKTKFLKQLRRYINSNLEKNSELSGNYMIVYSLKWNGLGTDTLSKIRKFYGTSDYLIGERRYKREITRLLVSLVKEGKCSYKFKLK